MSNKKLVTTLFVIFMVSQSHSAQFADSQKCPQAFAPLHEAQAEGINIALLTKIGKENKKQVTVIGIEPTPDANKALLTGRFIQSILTEHDCVLGAECNNLRFTLPFINTQLGDFRSNPFKVEDLEGTLHWLSPRSVKFLASSLRTLNKMLFAANVNLIMIDNYFTAPTAVQNKNPKNLDFLSSCVEAHKHSAGTEVYDRRCLETILLTTEPQGYLQSANLLVACATTLTYAAERALSYFSPLSATSMADDLGHSIVALLDSGESSHIIALITDSEFANTRQLLINQGFIVEDLAAGSSSRAN